MWQLCQDPREACPQSTGASGLKDEGCLGEQRAGQGRPAPAQEAGQQAPTPAHTRRAMQDSAWNFITFITGL